MNVKFRYDIMSKVKDQHFANQHKANFKEKPQKKYGTVLRKLNRHRGYDGRPRKIAIKLIGSAFKAQT